MAWHKLVLVVPQMVLRNALCAILDGQSTTPALRATVCLLIFARINYKYAQIANSCALLLFSKYVYMHGWGGVHWRELPCKWR